jgi:putative nucleotidyltransferase with HDIG domain
MDNKLQLKDLKDFAALVEPETEEKIPAEKEQKTYKKSLSDCTTKIINTASFRKLAGKTQVIISLSGPDIRTRLTHTIEVAKIAKDICTKLGLNADLAEAIALAHDIGHTPFGHVGERTLREIMCGCDTLDNTVNNYNFNNSGFKHNLQSFRVLNDIEQVHKNGNHKKIWPFVIWGAPLHTKLTWAKDYSGMDDEILISPKHCDWVYVCHHDNRKKCKRNIQIKKERKKNDKEICKPWYCAMLPILALKDGNKVGTEKLNGETTREYLKKEPIKEEYLDYIYCSHKCYLAKLWKYKINKKEYYRKYPYFFDHPFPNSFYIDSFFKYFKDNPAFFSLEAIIVSQADEIAQRQQDLEDGIIKKLLPFDKAIEDVCMLVKAFYTDEQKDKINNIFSDIIGDNKSESNQNNDLILLFDQITTSEDLGKFLTVFYINTLVDQTLKNMGKWAFNKKKEKINIYCLMNILHQMIDKDDKKTAWLLAELKACKKNKKTNDFPHKKSICDYFDIGMEEDYIERAYLFLICFDFFEQITKRSGLEQETQRKNAIELFSCCLDCINKNTKGTTLLAPKLFQELKDRFEKIDVSSKDHHEFSYQFIRALNSLSAFLREQYVKESDDFFNMDNIHWKTIGWLDLNSFYPLFLIYQRIEKGESINTVDDLKKIILETDDNVSTKKIFRAWKKIFKNDANKVISNHVVFFNKDHKDKNRAIKVFENSQRDIILKSEAVEKNDGKSSFILKRIFKAYIENSHQLSDSGLKFILGSLSDKEHLGKLLEEEKKTFEDILKELEETIIFKNNKINEIVEAPFWDIIKYEKEDELKKLQRESSNEVRASIDKRKELYEYFIKIKKKSTEIHNNLYCENENDKIDIQDALRDLRAILDNPILNSIPFWDSILTRAICDHIASLTDQEAVTEYEKLYTGIMELA